MVEFRLVWRVWRKLGKRWGKLFWGRQRGSWKICKIEI
ncbi:MAG: hypothetical protein MRERV_25c039 [Mycoplasmataceae bacterium RV_VA103A]|nr:MAG: hypothetical protein MRERV_25c039 [Mycoplasmataceae bacterium RV_VA103A]